MKTKLKLRINSLGIKLPFYLVLFCAILSTANALIGYRVFKSLFERQYKDVTEQIAAIALSYINGDRISEYAVNPVEDEEWKEADAQLEMLTQAASLAYIYVTVPDVNYEKRVYIFDTVNTEVKNNSKKYELGKVNTLKHYTEDRLNEMRKVMAEGESAIHFVYNKTGGHVTTSIPVKDSAGNNVAIMSIVKPMSEVKDFKRSYRNVVLESSSVITFLFVLIFILILLFRVIRPMRLITHETAHFAEHGGKISGILAAVKGRDELAVLARSVEKMSEDMNKYIADLTHTTAEKERLSAELDVATQIQANMLPRIFPPYENHPEIELFASMTPAKEVGGDFYDFFIVDNDHFAVVVGDVSGKGVPAALFMVIAKTLLKNVIMQGKTPAEVFTIVNNQLCEGNDAGLFVTCWAGILTLSTGELKFANAGHTSPVIKHDNKVEYLVSKPNLMLAGMEGMAYKDYSVKMKTCDRLFVYTDGITEATNAQNELYGEERLLSALSKAEASSSKEILAEVRKDIDKFVGDAPQFDDITMLEFSLKK